LAARVIAGDVDGLEGALPDNRAFLTGSHAYGTPNNKSDIDLVIYTNKKTSEELAKLSDEDSALGNNGYREEDARSLRFGDLNLLCVTDQIHFDIWREATRYMKQLKKKGAPISRQRAIEILAERRKKAGVEGL